MPYTEVMSKFNAGTLKSGGTRKVSSRKQAVAIMLSEKRKADSGAKPEYKPLYGSSPKRRT